MYDTTCFLRLMVNNFALEGASKSVEFSSEETLYPFTNAQNNVRTQVWKAKGCFEITSTNQYFYFNSSSVPITIGLYESGSDLASELQTQLNSFLSGWTVSYSTTTNRFSINHSGSVTFKFSNQTNAIWDTLGLTVPIDETGSAVSSLMQRNHYPYEYFIFDLGAFVDLGFIGLIGSAFEEFKITSAATITVQGNTINDFTNPPVEATLTRTPQGAFVFLDDVAQAVRFVKVSIEDMFNPLGSNGVEIGNIYIGDYSRVELRNINKGFSYEDFDPTEIVFSESGIAYADIKNRRTNFNDISYGLVNPSDMTLLKEIFQRVGKTTPFYISIDPNVCISDTISDLTRFVYFDSVLKFQHVFSNYYNMSFTLREAL